MPSNTTLFMRTLKEACSSAYQFQPTIFRQTDLGIKLKCSITVIIAISRLGSSEA